MFVGYPHAQKGWKVFDLSTEEFLISRDVVFQENEFPFSSQPRDLSITQPVLAQFDEDLEIPVPVFSDDRGSSSQPAVSLSDTAISTEPTSHDVLQPVLNPDHVSTTLSDISVPAVTPTTASPRLNPPPLPSTVEITEEVLGRGQRSRLPSVKLRDYVTYNAARLEDPTLALSCSASSSSETIHGNCLYPLTDYITDEKFSPSHQAFLAAVTAAVEPKYYSQAAKDKIWRGSMKNEILAHEENGTWDIVLLPPGKTLIGSRWIYKYKFNADGTVERPQSRLVVMGNN